MFASQICINQINLMLFRRIAHQTQLTTRALLFHKNYFVPHLSLNGLDALDFKGLHVKGIKYIVIGQNSYILPDIDQTNKVM